MVWRGLVQTYGEVVKPVGLHFGCGWRIVDLVIVVGIRYIQQRVECSSEGVCGLASAD